MKKTGLKSKAEQTGSKDKYHWIFEKNPMGIALLNIIYDDKKSALGMHVSEINKAFETQLKIKAGDAIGKTPGDLFPEAGQKLKQSIQDTLINGLTTTLEFFSKRTGHYHAVKIYPINSNLIVLAFDDIISQKNTRTELKETSVDANLQKLKIEEQHKEQQQLNKQLETALNTLHQSQYRYRELFEGSRDGIVIIDENGRFLDCNETYTKITGYPADELLKMDFYQITPEKWHEWERTEIVEKQLLQRGYSDLYEKEYIKKDGTVVPVEIRSYRYDGGPDEKVFLWGVVREISERKTMEKLAAQHQMRLSDIITHSHELHYAHNTKHVLTYVSPQCEEMLGFTAEEMKIRWTSLTTDHPVNKEGFDKTERAIKTGERQPPYFLELKQKNGNKIWVEVHESPVKNDQGEVTGIVGSLRDQTSEKQAHENLRQSNLKLKLAMEAAKETMWEWDLSTGICTLDDEGYMMLGYQPGEILQSGEWWISQIHPDDQAATRDKLNDFLDGKTEDYSAEFRLKRKNESYIWVSSHGKITRRNANEKPEMLVGIHRNITEKRQAEDELKNKHAELNEIFETIPDAVIYADPLRRILRVNRSFEKMFGYRLSEVYGKTTEFLYTDREHFLEQGRLRYNKNAEGSYQAYEITYKHKDGTELITETYGVPVRNTDNQVIGLMAIVRDISERKNAERKIREHEEMIRHTSESVLDIIWQMNNRMEFKYLSPSIHPILGYLPDEVIGKPVLQYIHPDDLEAVRKNIAEVIKSGSNKLGNQFRMINKSGNIVYVEVTSTVLRNDFGEISGFTGVTRDISQRKKWEEQLELYKHIVSSTPDAVSLVDRDYRYIIVNNAYEKLSGFSKQEFAGKHVADYLGEGVFNETIREKLDRCLTGETIQYESWFDYPAIGKRFMSVSYSPYYNDKDKISGVVAVTHDLTDMRHMEDLLRESDEKNRALSEATDEALFFSDNGVCIECNQAASEMFGYTYEELIGIFGTDLIADEWKATVKEHMLSGYEQPYEALARRKNGTTFWAEFHGKKYTYKGKSVRVTAIRDISDRKAAKEKLIRSEQEKSMILDSTIEMFTYYDTNLNIIWANQATSKTLKMNHDDIIGNKCYALWHKSKEPCKGCPVIKARDTLLPQSHEIQTPDGNYYFLRGYPVFDENKQVIGLIEFGQRITEHKKAENELKEKIKELERFNRIMVGRENKMIELKQEINDLCIKLGLPKRYHAPDDQ